MFTNFENVVTSMRRKLPFGIAQIGSSFRNEITPGNFIFRDREFEQMEMEFFCKPGTDEEWHAALDRGAPQLVQAPGRARGEPAHPRRTRRKSSRTTRRAPTTSSTTSPMGWSELEGIANRTDFDLKQHAKFSGKSLTYFDEEANEHIVPYVIEPAVGVDRTFLVLLYDAYREEEVERRKARLPRSSTRASRRSRSPCCRSRATRSWRRSRARCTRCCGRTS